MIIDPRARRAAEIICDGKNFVRRFTLAEQPLRIRTGRADREQLGRNSDKTRQQQLLPIEFRAEPRHGMKQTARQPFARPCSVSWRLSILPAPFGIHWRGYQPA